jgi:hypothetical protein
MKLAHVGLASALLVLGSTAVAQVKISTTRCINCDAVVLLSSGCGGGISVSPEPIEIEKDKEATITWALLNSDWAFADNGKTGIVIKHPANGVTLKSSSAKQVTWSLPKLPSGKIHKYDINVVKTKDGTTEKCSRDPTIVNY